ncbi:MAG: type II secretion system protein N [Burkholderiales bacterium]|nr:type II secretion system protein N [Burkholderiales bacterium]
MVAVRLVTRRLSWMLAAVCSVLLTVLLFLPASWVGLLVERQSQGRISLGDVQGTFWRGSAFVGAAARSDGPVTPLFAGRFSWKISPLILLGQLDVELDNPASLSPAVKLNGNLTQWQMSPAELALPPERLQGLGAPLNTIGPSGRLHLAWDGLQFTRQAGGLDLTGNMRLELAEMASRLSPVKPLGTYRLALDWKGPAADISLITIKGPMLLSGTGNLQGGHLQFSGKAWAQAGQEDRLANLLNLLGQRRRDGQQDVIALEFK